MDKERDMYLLNQIKYQYISEVFEKISNIPYAVIKGEPLSLDAYGALGCRGFGDIDILVSKQNLQYVENNLKELGFKTRIGNRQDRIFLLAYSHQLTEYSKCYNNSMKIEVDLNFDVFWGEHQEKSIDMNDFLSDVIEKEIYGVLIKVLSPMKTFIQLVLHHYKDMNSIFLLATKNSIKYNMFRDFYYYFRRNININSIDELYSLCHEYKILPYVYYVLYYTNVLFHDEKLEYFLNRFYNSKGEYLLNYYGLNQKERKKWRVDFKTRLNNKDLYSIIQDDLDEHDIEKIQINKLYF